MQAAIDTLEIRTSIMETLKYFNIFKFPLYEEEILNFLSVSITRSQLSAAVEDMVQEGSIFKIDDFFSLDNDPLLGEKRKRGKKTADILMQEAANCANLIATFPFVRAVCISGSLSKGYADERSDIDYFIITAERRLWICRTLLHLFKKLTFLSDKQHSFCMNYFLDESRPELDEKNLFTATELVTLMPLYGKEVYAKLVAENMSWVKRHLPNASFRKTAEVMLQRRRLTVLAERLINLFFPAAVNTFLMNVTDRVWRRKWKRRNYPMEQYKLAMKTQWYVSKNHPANYQKKILQKINRPATECTAQAVV